MSNTSLLETARLLLVGQIKIKHSFTHGIICNLCVITALFCVNDHSISQYSGTLVLSELVTQWYTQELHVARPRAVFQTVEVSVIAWN